MKPIRMNIVNIKITPIIRNIFPYLSVHYKSIQTAVQKWKRNSELDDRDIWLLRSLE